MPPLLNLDRAPGQPGTPFGVAGSQFQRPEFNREFFELPPEARLSTLQQFASSGQQLTPEEETIMSLLGKRVGRQRQQEQPQQEQAGGSGLLGFLSSLFQAQQKSNPFKIVGGAIEEARSRQ